MQLQDHCEAMQEELRSYKAGAQLGTKNELMRLTGILDDQRLRMH